MKVSIIGLGYIGLPTAALLSLKNISVVGVDINKKLIKNINSGKIKNFEPSLKKIILSSVKKKKFRAVSIPEKSDVFIISTPTPFKNNKPDISFVKRAVASIAKILEKNNLIIIESTSPVGTTEKIVQWLKNVRKDLSFPQLIKNSKNSKLKTDIAVAYCPERVFSGNVIKELVKTDRIIGGVSNNCSEKAKKFYKLFIHSQILKTDCRTAEFCKLSENSFRDVNIAFANELSVICKKLKINVSELIKLSNYHPRVNILNPGIGVGGHCIPVDPLFIIDAARKEAKIIQQARNTNNLKTKIVLKEIKKTISNLNKKSKDLSISCLGLAFKKDSDDLRESPALYITKKLSSIKFANFYVVEPNLKIVPNSLQKNNVKLVRLKDAIKHSNVIIILVDHHEFKKISFKNIRNKQIIDTRTK